MKSVLAEIRSSTGRLQFDWLKEAVLGLFSPRMSAVAFHLDYFVFPPVIIGCFVLALQQLNVAIALALVLVGMAAWTLAEYLLHRYALHRWPYFSQHHQAHHDSPRAMIAAPTLFTLAFFGSTFLLPPWFATGKPVALATFAGFLAGYVAFAAVHHTVHHAEGQGPILRHFKKIHAIHHHGSSDHNFGVLTGFWDRVFGTYSNKVRRH